MPSAPGDVSFCARGFVCCLFVLLPLSLRPRLPCVVNRLRWPWPLPVCFFSFRDSLGKIEGNPLYGVRTGKRGWSLWTSYPRTLEVKAGVSSVRQSEVHRSELDMDGGVCVCDSGKCVLKRDVWGR